MRFDKKMVSLKANLNAVVEYTVSSAGRDYRRRRKERQSYLEAQKFMPDFSFDGEIEVTGNYWGTWGGIDIYIPWNIGLLDALAKSLEEKGWRLVYQSEREQDELSVKFKFTHPDTEISFCIHMSAYENGQMGQSCRVEVIGEEPVPATTRKLYKIVCEGEEWENVDLSA